MEFRVIQGDIAAQSADALVNAAGTSLRMGSGVAGALRHGAGKEIDREAVEKGPVELGDVAITDAYNLDAECVIHAAAMPHYGDGNATETSIRSAARNALEIADGLGCDSLVIPALGCGVAGYDLEEGIQIIVEEIDRFEPDSPMDVRLIGFSEEEYDTMATVASEHGTVR